MTTKHAELSERLKRLGFAPENQLKLYGEEFELVSNPIIVDDKLVLVDAIEKRSRRSRRIRIPLPIVKMADDERTAA